DGRRGRRRFATSGRGGSLPVAVRAPPALSVQDGLCRGRVRVAFALGREGPLLLSPGGLGNEAAARAPPSVPRRAHRRDAAVGGGLPQAMSGELERGVTLFNRRAYFESHEVWEDLWQESEERAKE